MGSLMLHSEAAFRRGVGIEESRQEGFLWSEKSDNDPTRCGFWRWARASSTRQRRLFSLAATFQEENET